MYFKTFFWQFFKQRLISGFSCFGAWTLGVEHKHNSKGMHKSLCIYGGFFKTYFWLAEINV